MSKFPLSAIGLALLTLGTPGGSAWAQQATDIGKVTVTGEGDKLGNGLLIDEDTAKAKSTVTKAQIDKSRGSSNPYQLLSMLPGVNAGSYDATGLFGGNLRVRGFNSDQIGFTINGAPVNDSGNFAVYPQEYTDSENLCELFVTQGSTDTEAPHVGASGGNIGMTTCSPKDKAGGRFALGAGQLNYSRVFVRGDTGLIGAFKGFLSASKTQAHKWKGPGKADRDHIDAGVEYKLGNTTFSASLLWNKAVNNNIRSLTLAQLAAEGYYADFSANLPTLKTPTPGVADVDNLGAGATYYYGYSLNPFENYLITSKASIQFTPAVRLDIAPYFWYGYGTGGNEGFTVRESAPSGSLLHTGVADINGDGDRLDTVATFNGGLTQTNRPGVNATLSWTLDNQRILAGLWFERARHRQTSPASIINRDGTVGDIWENNPAVLVKYNDGSFYQFRNVLTISTAQSAFVQDSIDLLDSKLTVVPGVSWRSIKRDFTNYPSSGAGAFYQLSRTYSEVLPSLRASYQFTPETQGFVSVAKNAKAPGNFEYFGLANGITYTNGVGSYTSLSPLTVKQETSVNLDVGARYRNELFKASATAFLVKFKDRIARSYDPLTATSHDYNVGSSTMKGLELEVGTVPVLGFSAYASATYTKSTIDTDLPSGATTFYPTSGKQFPDTPTGMASLSLQYATGPVMVNLAGKYTGPRALTLVNDQRIAGYTTVDLNAAYQLPNVAFLKNPTLRLNVSNLTNKQYLLANSGSGSSISIAAAGYPGAFAPSIYLGAPRFSSVSFQSDF
ncbi:MAG: TonB-dependent receptor [Burkholderiales bacterium]|nr:TonB-dependent receptor [Burkholderiales bacterium]